MAIIKKRGDKLYIQWYDPLSKKIQSKSTGLNANDTNLKKAKRYANKLQSELTKESQKLKQIGINHSTLEQAFEHFLRNNQNKHPKTIKDYNRFFKKFTERFNEDMPCSSITKLQVEDWLNEIKQLPLAKNTIHGYGKQLTHFLNFLFEYSYTPMFKINREVKTKPEVKEKVTFSDKAIIKIFDNLDEKNSNFITTIYLLFYTGLRSSDIMTITKENIDLKNRIINYYSPKRKKYREIAFHEDLVPILKNRISEIEDEQILNYSKVENLGKAVTRYVEFLGLRKEYTARTFRKTFITLCRSRYDMDASVVRELVGHEHTNTTDRYYNQISVKKMRNELLKFKRPVSKSKSEK